MMQLNVNNAVKLTYLFGNEFKKQILNNVNTPNSKDEFRFLITSSFASLIVCPFLSVYSGTKFYLLVTQYQISNSFNRN